MMMAQKVHTFKFSYILSASQPHWLEHLMKILVIGLKTNTIEQQGSFESTACLKVLVLSVTGGQIPMAMVHSAFSFGLNTLLERCILLHLQINVQLW